ncbi:hypothetical protein AXF42_Ash017296 [Apostasia shenzhenica]|uniref:Uncharacterized protein n=1 Tax=Apostasia shenzhenica TaxID=1088818 RepID=A0A2H9ZVL5_9ASPA|nr:hypothetical protein AXF42_Ash017296 [Apostasia shenzhenica]
MKKGSLKGLYNVFFGKKKEEKKRAPQLGLCYNESEEIFSSFLMPPPSLCGELFSGICSW